MKKRIFTFILILFLTSPVITHGAEKAMTFGLWTQHYKGDHTEGVDNHLLALEYKGVVGAWFKNSYGRETGFIGGAYHTKKLQRKSMWFRGNLYGGVLIGYGNEHPINFGMLSPGIYPTASVGYQEYSLELGVLPTFWWLVFRVNF